MTPVSQRGCPVCHSGNRPDTTAMMAIEGDEEDWGVRFWKYEGIGNDFMVIAEEVL